MIFKFQDQAWKAWIQLQERLPHAILIQSGEGMGEFEFAQACAQSLLCEKPGPDRRASRGCLSFRWVSPGNRPGFRPLGALGTWARLRGGGAGPGGKERRKKPPGRAGGSADSAPVRT